MIQSSDLPVSQACKALEVTRSGYYSWKNDEPPPDPDLKVRMAIQEVALEFPGYGYRRIDKALRRKQVVVNHKKVLRLMREENLLCKRKSFKPHTTNSNHDYPLSPNLTKDLVVTRINQVWVSDITYIEIGDGYVYLAVIIDRYSRKCVGWELSRRIDSDLALNALDIAIASREVFGLKGLIHNSDRGVQYASIKYVKRVTETGMVISMTESGNPRENAYAESFMKTIKVEEVYLKEYRTFDEAYKNIQRFIEDVYNAKRLHSSIGYKAPNEMEAEVLNIR